MKRLLSLAICVLILFSVPAVSFAALDNGEFTFQYGNRWGMTPDEVIATFPEEAEADRILDWANWDEDEDTETLLGLHLYDPEILGGDSIDSITYLFDNDRLYAAVYRDYGSKELFPAQVALERVYGKGIPSYDSYFLLAGLFNAAMEETPFIGAFSYTLCWALEDGTNIILTQYDEDLILVYYNLEYYASDLDTSGL
jgi:hypothetical protein